MSERIEQAESAQAEREAFEAYRDRRNALLESEGHKPGSKWHVTQAHYATWAAARAALAQPSPEPCPCQLGNCLGAEEGQWCKAQPSPAPANALNRPGYDRLWAWFGLGRASFTVLPRVMMHDMPDDWQGRMAELLEQWCATWRNQPDISVYVQVRQGNRFIKAPDWLLNYRHPDRQQLAAMRGAPLEGGE